MNKNILFITSDQQHWSAMGYLNPEIKTPNLDKLVASGMAFQRAYTPNPTCTPTRASWITGLYPSQHGAYSLGTKLMEDVPTIGDILQKENYRTALIGKAHFQPLLSTNEYSSLESYPTLHDLDFWKNFNDNFYGFEHIELARNHTNESHAGQHYALWMKEKGYENWRDYFVSNLEKQTVEGDKLTNSKHVTPAPGEAWDIPEEIHYDTWIAERTNKLMEQYKSKNENFFLWASFFDPHPPYMCPEPFASMYDPDEITIPSFTEGEFDDKPPYFKYSQLPGNHFQDFQEEGGNGIHGSGCHVKDESIIRKNMAMMYGMVTMMDKYIGKIIDKVYELGLENDTLICFTTDHGDFYGQHGLTRKAIHHYEDLIKIPLVVSMPGTIPENTKSDSLQSTVDLAPTFLNFAGVNIPRSMTGIDETNVWNGNENTIRDHVIIENQHQPTTMNLRTYVNDQYKLTIHYNRDYGELYDLKNDPNEIINLWDSSDHSALKSDLLLKFLYGEMGKAPLPMPRIAGA
ncbi:MAG: sulfatase [Planctomycetota bacterium]|nr:MAG: sulfatase [Planctomycetota bacterium]